MLSVAPFGRVAEAPFVLPSPASSLTFPYNFCSMPTVVHAACPHDCPDACGVLITIDDGRAIKIQGDPAHPVTRGFLCAKVAKYIDRVYSPDRVLFPLRRLAPKGTSAEGAFARISWNEA